MVTPKIVKDWVATCPIRFPKNRVPNKPAMAEPTRGASGIAQRWAMVKEDAMRLTFKVIQIFSINGVDLTEEDHQNG